MPRKKSPNVWNKISISLPRLVYSRLLESATSNQKALSAEARRAIEFYLANLEDMKKMPIWQAPLEFIVCAKARE